MQYDEDVRKPQEHANLTRRPIDAHSPRTTWSTALAAVSSKKQSLYAVDAHFRVAMFSSRQNMSDPNTLRLLLEHYIFFRKIRA
jgi:hypothetical protein